MTVDTALHRPRLRGIQAHPVDYEGRRLIYLRDPSEVHHSPLLVTQEALALLSLMDGVRTLPDIISEAAIRWSLDVPVRELEDLIRTLDEALLLESPGYRARQDQLRAELAAAPLRPAVHAGGAYVADPADLRRSVHTQFRAEGGPGGPPVAGVREAIRAAVFPHVDLHRGGPTYAWGYRALAEAPPADTYILLGTSHSMMSRPFSVLRKPFDTPLGSLPVDHEITDQLHDALGEPAFDDILPHRNEHSLEIQAVYLRALGLAGGDSPAAIVPILCQALQAYVAPDGSPRDTQDGRAFITALQEILRTAGKRVCIIAGADLAHVGPQFGDAAPVDHAVLEMLVLRDRAMLELVRHGDAEGFYAHVMEDGDARRICGLAPIYYTLAIAEPPPGELLRYTQWADPSGASAVTFASMVFPDG